MTIKKTYVYFMIMVLFLGGCTNSSLDDGNIESKYEIVQEYFIQEEIDVKYPQINGLENDKQDEINKFIKSNFFEQNINEQMKRAKEFEEMNGIEDKYILSLDYIITLGDENILSILWTGVGGFRTSSHLSHITYSLTIDMNSVEILALSDFIEIDDNFIEELKTSSNVTNSTIEEKDSKITKEDLLKATRQEMTGMEEYIKSAYSRDSELSPTFAVTSDSLLISVPVNHVIGDYAIIEILYNSDTKK